MSGRPSKPGMGIGFEILGRLARPASAELPPGGCGHSWRDVRLGVETPPRLLGGRRGEPEGPAAAAPFHFRMDFRTLFL